MARHIPFSPPVNASEKWAFDFLNSRLPDHYVLLTNVELIGLAGFSVEVDAVVIGDYAIYLVDVKGYTGKVEAGRHLWLADGQEVENPLPKINKNSKIFAGRIRRKIGPVGHTPWVQGMAFVTGSKGESLSLIRTDDHIAAYSAKEIVNALTESQYIPLPSVYRLRESQKTAALEEIGQVAAVEKKANSIGDYTKNEKLLGDARFSIWTATFNRHGLDLPYILKCIEPSAWSSESECDSMIRDLKREFRIYQELTGAAGVPYVAPLIDTGEQIVLPIKHPRGKPVSAIDVKQLTLVERLTAIRSAAIALETVHGRGVVHGNLSRDNIYISDDQNVELLDFGTHTGTSSSNAAAEEERTCSSDISRFAEIFLAWLLDNDDPDQETAEFLAIDRILDWFSEAKEGGATSLAVLEGLIVQPARDSAGTLPTSSEWEPTVGKIMNETYGLVQQTDRSDSSSTWVAKHLLGNFRCVVMIFDAAEEQLENAQREFGILSRLYHPGLSRTFDMGRIQGTDMYFMSMALVSDPTLRALIDEGRVDDDTIESVLRDACNVLEYMHKSGVTHRNISPDTIVVSSAGAILTSLSAIPGQQLLAGDIRYKWPGVTENGWTPYADLYGLAVTALEAWIGHYPLSVDFELSEQVQLYLGNHPKNVLAAAAANIVASPVDELDSRYARLFGLPDESGKITELPQALIEQFNISRGYMTFLVLDMLNDQRPRSRNQWVLEALRSRHIPGNKTNKGSMSATISRLKSAGIAENHGKKIRLTQAFLSAVTEALKPVT
jgi:serine/threonine protein kinase